MLPFYTWKGRKQCVWKVSKKQKQKKKSSACIQHGEGNREVTTSNALYWKFSALYYIEFWKDAFISIILISIVSIHLP